MKIKSIILFSAFHLFTIAAFAQVTPGDSLKVIADTSSATIKAEEEIIDDVIERRTVPQKDKVQYFSQLTRYGFKDLFASYSYNSAMPYSSQVNPRAESYMQDYLRTHSKYLIDMKKWCMPYFNLIDNILTQYGLPKELKYLAVIESNLSTAATSTVGAGGPWQFMPGTARNFGLTVNAGYDERRDYFKSTHAAARYLLILYRQLHDWLLVIAAYNGGPGRVNSAVAKSGSHNFWALQYYLPEESRNHVKKFIATHYIMEGSDADKRNNTGTFSNQKPTLSVQEMQNASTEKITGKFNSVVIAKSLSMDILSFNRYNPLFDSQISANGNYELILPQDKMQLFILKRFQILNESVQVMLSEDTPVDYSPKPRSKKKN